MQKAGSPRHRARWRLIAAAAAVLAGLGCSDGATAPAPSPPPSVGPLEPSEPFGLTTVTLRSPDNHTALSIPVYDAYQPRARRRGLMGRTRLPARSGMLFRFPQEHQGGFWMKDTLIPLSIAYVDGDGRVLAVMDMQPCRTERCPSYDPEVTYRGALEVNQGFFDRIGLKPGWRIEAPFGLPPAS